MAHEGCRSSPSDIPTIFAWKTWKMSLFFLQATFLVHFWYIFADFPLFFAWNLCFFCCFPQKITATFYDISWNWVDLHPKLECRVMRHSKSWNKWNIASCDIRKLLENERDILKKLKKLKKISPIQKVASPRHQKIEKKFTKIEKSHIDDMGSLPWKVDQLCHRWCMMFGDVWMLL